MAVTRLPESVASLPLPPDVVPIPIVLDGTLRLPIDCKMIRRHQRGEGKQPWVICSPHADPTKKVALEEQGVKIVEAEVAPKTGESLSWPALQVE